jgi:heme-degrading monooxygenase HmoA
MNRFKIVLGAEKTFEDIWRFRDSTLKDVDGFLTFNLIKGESNDQYTLYASHTGS